MTAKKELIFDFDSPVKNSQSPSESQILPRRSARAHNNKEEEEEEAAASPDPKSKNEKEKKKRKRGPQPPSSPSEKSNSFATIWSEEDEIKILQGVIADKQSGPTPPKYSSNSTESFLAMVGPSLSFNATGPQLQSKIRHLRERYAHAPAARKSKAKGHKKALYDLCDKIWSSRYAAADDDGSRSYPELKIAVERQGGYLSFNEVAAALGEGARELDEEFKKLREKEKELWKQIHERL